MCFTLFRTLTSTARLQSETSQCDVLWKTWTYDDKCSFLCLNTDKSRYEFNSRKCRLHFTNWAVPKRRDKLWKDANSFFSDIFTASSSLLLKLPNLSFWFNQVYMIGRGTRHMLPHLSGATPFVRCRVNVAVASNSLSTTSSPHFSSGIVERAKRERTWKSRHPRKARRDGERISCGVIFTRARVSLALLSLREKGDYS